MLNDLPMGSRLAHHRGLPALNRMLRFPLAVNARAWNTPTMLAVVVADVEGEGEYQFERRQFGTTPDHLRLLSEWFVEQEVEEVVMESTAQYW